MKVPLKFEPHNLYRTGVCGEDWPLGYISRADVPGRPIFALHDVLDEQSKDELTELALCFTAAPELLEALSSLLAVAEMTTFSDQYPAECEAARAAIAKATGTQIEGRAA